MSHVSSNDRLDDLLSRLVDGIHSEADARELESLLNEDPAARERYRLFMALHLELAANPRELPERALVPIWQRAGLPLAVAAVLMLLAAFLFWRGSSKPEPLADSRPADSRVLAVAARVENAVWDLDAPPATGAKFHPGMVNLLSGVITLDLVGGQQVTLKAPARFEMISEQEMMLYSGDAALRMDRHGVPPYIIRVPGGAVVDLGTEISVKVHPDGVSDVRVFDGKANVSSVDAAGRTRHERLLHAGESVQIGKTLAASDKTELSFLRSLTPVAVERSVAGDAYVNAISRARPLAWWRFEQIDSGTHVPPTAGPVPLLMGGQPRVSGPEGRRFLMTNRADAAGFALAEAAIPGLDTASGFSVEMLIYPGTENGTAFAFDQPELPVPLDGPIGHGPHSPHRMIIERSGPNASGIGHIHPDFALRAMLRSPAGYEGGTNMYSSESHLMHRWIHVVFTHDGRSLRLYIDGRLSDETPSDLEFQNAALRPILGRMQPLPVGKHRQWHGGIDEVALYGRALDAAEVATHAAALED